MLSPLSVSSKQILLPVLLGSVLLFTAHGQSVQAAQPSTSPAEKSRPAAMPARNWPHPTPQSARDYYAVLWGVDSLSVKSVESGEIIRFSYRVLDPAKAKILNDKKSEPSLIDPGAGVKLVVPSLEKIGQLRQSSTPIGGKVYWMAFSNQGRHVKPGHHVSVTIGQFRADDLIVQ